MSHSNQSDGSLGENSLIPLKGMILGTLGGKKIFSAAPIQAKDANRTETEQIDGYLYIILGGEQYDSVAGMLQASYVLRLSSWALIGSLVFVFIAGLLLFRVLTSRLTRLSHAIDSFRKSQFKDRPEPLPTIGDPSIGDEIDQVGATFSEMADHIIEQMGDLERTDLLRRELVANVSHDLRTPLTSLQGYLETLLIKEGKLSLEEQRNYLETATKHSHRLGKLIEELFELAKLESHDTQPHFEACSIGELIQDVLQKFTLAAHNKKILFKTDFSADLPFVSADIGLMERVLENLLENALRFTPDGGTITLSLSPINGRIMIKVMDSGCGIPEEELPYIFDRFYRVSQNHREERGGSGLGLAITKRILELHDSTIQATSTLNAGTTFTFFLTIRPSVL